MQTRRITKAGCQILWPGKSWVNLYFEEIENAKHPEAHYVNVITKWDASGATTIHVIAHVLKDMTTARAYLFKCCEEGSISEFKIRRAP